MKKRICKMGNGRMYYNRSLSAVHGGKEIPVFIQGRKRDLPVLGTNH